MGKEKGPEVLMKSRNECIGVKEELEDVVREGHVSGRFQSWSSQFLDRTGSRVLPLAWMAEVNELSEGD